MDLFPLQTSPRFSLSRPKCRSPSWAHKELIRLTNRSIFQRQRRHLPSLLIITMLTITRLHFRHLQPCLRRLFLLDRLVGWCPRTTTALRNAQHMSRRGQHRSPYRPSISFPLLPCACFSTHHLKICKRASRECGVEIWKCGVGAAASFRFLSLEKLEWIIYGKSGYSIQMI